MTLGNIIKRLTQQGFRIEFREAHISPNETIIQIISPGRMIKNLFVENDDLSRQPNLVVRQIQNTAELIGYSKKHNGN